jgi:hypothetical protein
MGGHHYSGNWELHKAMHQQLQRKESGALYNTMHQRVKRKDSKILYKGMQQ